MGVPLIQETVGTQQLRFFRPRIAHLSSPVAKWAAEICMAILIAISITAPAITLRQGLPWVRLEQLLLPLIFAVYFWMLLAGMVRKTPFNIMFLVGAVYSCCILLSTVYGADILGQPVILRDFYEIPKAWLPVFFFTLAYQAKLDENALRRVLKFFGVAVAIICLYAIGQWFNLGWTRVLNIYYSGGEHIDGGLARYRRVYSTMGNSNVLGQLMTWSIVTFTMAALFKAGSRLRNILLAFACLVALAMTGSRYGLITSSIGIIMIFLLPSSAGIKRRWVQIALLLVLLPLFGWTVTTVATKNQATLDRLESLRDPLQTDSFRKRLDVLWQDAGADISRSPILGLGPAKERFTDVFTDSEYLDVIKKFGAIGFLTYLLYYIFPLFFLCKGLRSSRTVAPFFEEFRPATFLAMRLSFVMGVTALIMNIGESTFYNQLLQAFLWMWLGLGVSAAESIASFARTGVPNLAARNHAASSVIPVRPAWPPTFRQQV